MNEFEKRRKEREIDKSLDGQVDCAHNLLDDLREVLIKHDGRTTVPLVLGVLETLKYEVLFNQTEQYTLD